MDPSQCANSRTYSTASSSTSMTFTEQDRCMLRLQKILQSDARDVLHYIFLLGTSDRDVTKPLSDYLTEVIGFSSHRIRNKFNKLQRERVLSDFEGRTYDVTLLCTCIMMACFAHDTEFSWASSWLERLVLEVKNFRNELMHEGFTGDQADFMKKVEEIRSLLVDILKTAGDVYEVDKSISTGRIQLLNQSISMIRDDALDPLDASSYEAENLFIHKQKLVLTDGVEELRSVYSRWSFVTPATVLFENMQMKVDMVYTNTTMIKKCTEGTEQEISYADLLQFVENSNTNTNLGNVAQIILAEGVAGSGKSTLTKFMMSEWIAKNSTMKNLDDFDLLLFVECKSSCLKSLTELLLFLMPKTASKFRHDDFLKSVLNLRLLLIVDGLDELNEASASLFNEILQLKRTVDITILCTTRPERVKDFCKMVPDGYQKTYLVITGIAEEKKVEFVLKYCEEMKNAGKTVDDVEGLIKFVKTSTHLQGYWRLPMNLMLMTIIWAKSSSMAKNKCTTTTKLYIDFLNITKEQLMRRLQRNKKTCNMTHEDIERKLEVILMTVHREALTSLRQDEIYLTAKGKKRICEACASVGLPSDEVIGTFLMQTNTWTSIGPLTQLSFIHKGMQDFHSALFIKHRHDYKGKLDVQGINQGFQEVMTLYSVRDNVRRDVTEAVLEILGRETSETDPSSSRGSELHRKSSFESQSEDCQSNDSRTETRDDLRVNLKDKGEKQYHTKNDLKSEAVKKDAPKSVVSLWRRFKRKPESAFTSYVPILTSSKSSTRSIPSALKENSTTLMLKEDSTSSAEGPILRTLKERGSIDLNKYQNVLMLLGGLLHDTGGEIQEDTTKEIVDLLARSGIENRKQWLDLLAEVECDPRVVHAVFHRVPTLLSEVVEVDDTTVDAYASLFILGCCSAVKVRIRGNTERIPRLRPLLEILAMKRVKMMLYFIQDFRNAGSERTTTDMVQFAFSRCNIQKFWGRLDINTIGNLPETLQGLALMIEDRAHYQVLEKTLVNLTVVLPNLSYLWIHILRGIEPAILKPLPSVRGPLRLYLSEVNDANILWTTKICQALKPKSREFTNLRFPRSGLTVTGCKGILSSLRKAKVPVALGGVWVSSPDILQEEVNLLKRMYKEVLGCNFHLVTEEELWST